MSMRSGGLWILYAALWAAGIAGPGAASAQADSSRSVTCWINFGMGIGTTFRSGTNFGGNASLNIRWGHALATIHSSAAAELLGASNEDYGILFGYASDLDDMCVSIAAGAAIIRTSTGGLFTQNIERRMFGAPVEIQCFYRPWRWFGFGLCAFTVFDGPGTFGGLTFSLQAGLLR